MNNEIGRKITSLTLMTIMLAGGMTFAAPGMVPEAHAANANLFVSAENSQFDNYMSGPQVIEVVVIDSDINDTDQGKGEPDVTVNGKKLRMVQAVDGNWYGYFADRDQAVIADTTTTTDGEGLDFGAFCTAASAGILLTDTNLTDIDFTDTSGVAVINDLAGSATGNPAAGATVFGTCTDATINTADHQNVLREQKAPNGTDAANQSDADATGQIGVKVNAWPFIQLYTLNPTGNVVVQYNKGGGTQTVTLTFDTVDQFAGATLDRAVYPRDAQVHVTITDLWLNIDPTDEDSWTFGTVSGSTSTVYQVFNENGVAAGAASVTGLFDVSGSFGTMMIEKNGVLILNADAQTSGTAVVTLQDNGDSVLAGCPTAGGIAAGTCDASGLDTDLGAGTNPITITEQGPNSGVFGTYDESDVSVVIMTSGALRGTSATIDYNETPTTILAGFDFGTIDIQPIDDEWSSGEEIPVVLVDGDANKNSRADEDLDLNDPTVALIPSLQTGDPFTLGEDSGSAQQALFIDMDGGVGAFAVPQTVTAASSGGVVYSGTINTSSFSNADLLGTQTGSPSTGANAVATSFTVQSFSQRALIDASSGTTADAMFIDMGVTMQDVRDSLGDTTDGVSGELFGFNLVNIDLRSLSTTALFDVYLFAGTIDETTLTSTDVNAGDLIPLAINVGARSITEINTASDVDIFADAGSVSSTAEIGYLVISNTVDSLTTSTTVNEAIVIDIFTFGFTDDGVEANERVSNQIVRLELEETGDNTSTFVGTLEYTMINQLNILTSATYSDLVPVADEATFIVIEDLTDEDAPRINYNDRGADGVVTPIADQEEAPSHSGTVSLDTNNYKVADTVTVTLEDGDLNVNSDLIDIFTVVNTVSDEAYDAIGLAGLQVDLSFGDLGRMLDITFDDERWLVSGQTGDDGSVTCGTPVATAIDDGLSETGFTLVETSSASGVFTGDFQIPTEYCKRSGNTGTGGVSTTVTGTDIEVNYVDYRDASGEIIEVGDSAGVRANTGSISLDRTVYPVPWGVLTDIGVEAGNADDTGSSTPNSRSVFPIHKTGITSNVDTIGETLGNGDLTIHLRVNDPDADLNPSGQDTLATDVAGAANTYGPVKITVSRGSNVVTLAYAGGAAALTTGVIDADDDNADISANIRQMGPMTEIAPDAGIFELDFVIRYTDGPASSACPTTTLFTDLSGTGSTADTSRFDETVSASDGSGNYCILQGDIITVQYTDPTDASGDVNTVTDSATFDLRNGVLQSDKSVYIIGSDMILTIIEPDWDLDNDAAETYDIDILEWDSDAATTTIGDSSIAGVAATDFDPEPSAFRETGDSTGIFQVVIEVPSSLNNDNLERGEEIVLEYTDWGPSGSNYVGEEKEDVNLTVFTSNFGATVELDQKVYTWTDKVYLTVVAPDHNFDSDLIDDVGNTSDDPIKVSTRGFNINTYKLVETGTDTGIFTGEVILTGFSHDADGKTTTGTATNGFDTTPQTTSSTTAGPTDGFLQTDEDDGLTISFEFSEDETVVGSALIRWNIGEVQWLEASYPASGTGVVRIIDPDMNLNPESVDNFAADVWSDSDAGGIDLTVTETNEATGIFEGTVFFTTTDESSGHRLRVAEGDTVTAEYEDNTLPDPYTRADELDITATSLIGTIVPPLERAPAANLRTVDAFGNSLDSVTVDQQVQISADLANGQDREQTFAYLVQIQDGNGVTVSLAWITGSLSSGQSFSPALSWIPTEAGTYTATAFVWESVDNPTALSAPVSTTVNVR
jgi:hypothetical protein